MKRTARFLSLLLVGFALLSFTGCVTTSSNTPKPPDSEYSSMPHNLPQAWEGQAAMGGLGSQYQ